MKPVTMGLQPFDYELVFKGLKTVEGRVYDEKRRAIRVGSIVNFRLEPERAEGFDVEVTAMHCAPDFETLLDEQPVVDFGYPDRESYLKALERFYSAEDQKSWGVVGIRFRKITE